MITDINLLNPDKKYTYADYLQWMFEERVELLRGKIFKMSPAPNTRHQRISGKIFYLISYHLNKNNCDVFAAPFDVRLSVNEDIKLSKKYRKKTKSMPDGKIQTVVQPDICVICDSNKLDEKGCIGAPDLIVEILSPGNSGRELKDKFEIYQEAGVPEYWIVDPEREIFLLYYLTGKGYIGSQPFCMGDYVISKVIDGLKISVDEVLHTPKPQNHK